MYQPPALRNNKKKKRIYISNELKLKNYIYELFGWLHEEPEVIID